MNEETKKYRDLPAGIYLGGGGSSQGGNGDNNPDDWMLG